MDMLVTRPVPINFLTDPADFVFGSRISHLIQLPFSPQTLKERLLRKMKDKAVMALYIETRDMADRLNWVVGDENWDLRMDPPTDFGDRIGVLAHLRIGKTWKTGEGEELKLAKKVNYVDNPAYDPKGSRDWKVNPKRIKQEDIVTAELGLTKAGPQACKRAGVWYGIAEYLYKFPEDIVKDLDSDGNYTPGIDFKSLPAIAIPPSGPLMVLQELAYLFRQPIPTSMQALVDNKELAAILGGHLKTYWGIESLKSTSGMTEEDFFRLAGCIARCSDYLDRHRSESFESLLAR